jgi:hypothetical protein
VMNGGFVKFATLDEGWYALKKILADYIAGPTYGFSSPPTLEQITSKYAPSADRNDPLQYARNVSQWTGIPLGVPVLSVVTGQYYVPDPSSLRPLLPSTLPSTLTDPVTTFTVSYDDAGNVIDSSVPTAPLSSEGLNPTTMIVLGVGALLALLVLIRR